MRLRIPSLRRRRPPEAVAAAVDGRLLAWAESARGWLAGTPTALHVVPHHGAPLRLPWEEVQHADWRADDEVLEVVTVGEFGRPRATYSFRLGASPATLRLAQLVRERVTASVVLQRRVDLGDKRGFTVLGRRNPAGGALSWFVDYDAGIEPDAVAEQVDAAVAQARAEVGDQPI
jgi:hypothetical protein